MSIPSTFAAVSVDIWRCLAGTYSPPIPPVNSYVYYFPQGHLEQSPSLQISSLSPILCRVDDIQFLCSKISDQPFVKYLLVPIIEGNHRMVGDEADEILDDENPDVISFSKILAPSDTSRSDGLNVPLSKAGFFPPLDYSIDQPLQMLKVLDVVDENVFWEVRHSCRRATGRHMLQGEWSKFVTYKRLVAGDEVVVMHRKSTNDMLFGIRRAMSDWIINDSNNANTGEAPNGVDPFEVVYFPKSGAHEFVVSANKVDKAREKRWYCGMRVRMRVESEYSWERMWLDGEIEELVDGTEWRMLQVKWDDPQLFLSRVSPWMVECTTPHEEASTRGLMAQKMLFEGGEQRPNANLQLTNFTMSTPTHNSGLTNSCNPSPLPIVIQRPWSAFSSSLPNDTQMENQRQSLTELLMPDLNDQQPELYTDCSTTINIGGSSLFQFQNFSAPSPSLLFVDPRMETGHQSFTELLMADLDKQEPKFNAGHSTPIHLGSSSQPEDLSASNQRRVNDIFGNRANSFQLFGKTIYVEDNNAGEIKGMK